jgi:hypothetical protein
VVFECVRTALSAAAPGNPNLSYTYQTDQELVQASQTANAYCLKYGSQPMTSNMVTNSDGTKSVTFQCVVHVEFQPPLRPVAFPFMWKKKNGAFFRLVKCTTSRPPWQAATGGTRREKAYQQVGRSA